MNGCRVTALALACLALATPGMQAQAQAQSATSGRLDAILVLEDGFQFLRLKKRQADDVFGEFVQISHFSVPFL